MCLPSPKEARLRSVLLCVYMNVKNVDGVNDHPSPIFPEF